MATGQKTLSVGDDLIFSLNMALISSLSSPLPRLLSRGCVKLTYAREQAGACVSTTRELVGLMVEGRHLPRHDYPIEAEGNRIGHVTSGGYSPTLDRNIAMGYVPHEFASHGKHLQVDIRGRLADATVTSLPFYMRKREP